MPASQLPTPWWVLPTLLAILGVGAGYGVADRLVRRKRNR